MEQLASALCRCKHQMAPALAALQGGLRLHLSAHLRGVRAGVLALHQDPRQLIHVRLMNRNRQQGGRQCQAGARN